MVKEGKAAPDFVLPSGTGADVRLSDFRGKTVVLFFYPRDNTPGCTREACGFRDSLAQFGKRGVVVVGVSPDSLASHEKFRAEHGLKFTLLSDPDKNVARAYGAFGEKVMYGKKVVGMIRSTFLIDREGIIRKIFASVKVDGHVERVLAAVEAL